MLTSANWCRHGRHHRPDLAPGRQQEAGPDQEDSHREVQRQAAAFRHPLPAGEAQHLHSEVRAARCAEEIYLVDVCSMLVCAGVTSILST